LLALGAHHAVAELPKIRERLVDAEEHPLVRAAAAQALAALCDLSALTSLTNYALKLADPTADANQHVIGAARCSRSAIFVLPIWKHACARCGSKAHQLRPDRRPTRSLRRGKKRVWHRHARKTSQESPGSG